MLSSLLSPILDALPPIVWLIIAMIGHAALLSVSLNIWYGHALPHKFLSVQRKLHTLLVPAGPVVFVLLYGLDPASAWRTPPAGLACIPALYLLACWLMALVVLPLATLARLVRRLPAAQRSNDTRTIDVARHLGYKPVGDGKHRRLARLPFNEVFRVDLTEKTFVLPQLPAAWDGLKILHLTDVHLCGTPEREFYFHIMDQCRDWQPDILALTGDIVDSPRHHRWVLPVLGRLRWNIAAFAILGNHDNWYEPARTRRRLQKLGMRVLANTWERIEVRGQPLVVVGHEGPWFTPAPDVSACPENTFRLCLSHTPDNIPWARRHGMDLMLAGHNHGGQIRLPLIGSILVPSRFSRRYDCGTFHEPPTLLHVCRGLGGQHPLRYNCRPEVTCLILRKGDSTQVGVDPDSAS